MSIKAAITKLKAFIEFFIHQSKSKGFDNVEIDVSLLELFVKGRFTPTPGTTEVIESIDLKDL